MPITNHGLAHRPLLAAVAIYNPNVNEVGTLGLIATSDGTDRWIVNCYHALACNLSAVVVTSFASGESIFQGSAHDGVVAKTADNGAWARPRSWPVVEPLIPEFARALIDRADVVFR
jgi:hypothetical protein